MFKTAHIAEYGTSVAWGDDGDLLIDAAHLGLIAAEQRPIDVSAWQGQARLSNQEAAEMMDVSLSTWNAYKASTGKVPPPVAIAMRAALRAPLVMQAHFRPRKPGCPKKEATTR